MRSFWVAAAVLAAALLAACAPTREEFETGRRVAGESPAARKALMEQCMRKASYLTLAQEEQFATVMKTSANDVPALFCQRILTAVVSGRLTYDETRNLRRVSQAKLARILQGR